jgi:hypothetical protein
MIGMSFTNGYSLVTRCSHSELEIGTTVSKAKRPMQHNLKLALSSYSSASSDGCDPVDRRIRAFLAGQTHGEDVLEALYGHVADEPVPERLRALFKSC